MMRRRSTHKDETIRLISDRHIQRGKSFPHPSDVMIDVPSAAGEFS